MDLSTEQLLGIAQYSFVRMDGAWFMALAKRFGVETAWEMLVTSTLVPKVAELTVWNSLAVSAGSFSMMEAIFWISGSS